jgi:hypothetical protein
MKTILVPKKHEVCVECSKSLNPRTHKLSCKGFMRNPTCNTCTRSANDPYRVSDKAGNITEGCVDEFHTKHLVSTSASYRWHNRKESFEIRKASKARRVL